MKDGQPYAIMGSPGGDDQVMRTMQTLINMIDFDMNIQQAIEAPRWSSRAFPASPFPHTMYPKEHGRRVADPGGDPAGAHCSRPQAQKSILLGHAWLERRDRY